MQYIPTIYVSALGICQILWFIFDYHKLDKKHDFAFASILAIFSSYDNRTILNQILVFMYWISI